MPSFGWMDGWMDGWGDGWHQWIIRNRNWYRCVFAMVWMDEWVMESMNYGVKSNFVQNLFQGYIRKTFPGKLSTPPPLFYSKASRSELRVFL